MKTLTTTTQFKQFELSEKTVLKLLDFDLNEEISLYKNQYYPIAKIDLKYEIDKETCDSNCRVRVLEDNLPIVIMDNLLSALISVIHSEMTFECGPDNPIEFTTPYNFEVNSDKEFKELIRKNKELILKEYDKIQSNSPDFEWLEYFLVDNNGDYVDSINV